MITWDNGRNISVHVRRYHVAIHTTLECIFELFSTFPLTGAMVDDRL